MLRGLAAADADVGEVFFVKRYAARFDAAGHVLDLVFAFDVAAPHRLDEAAFVLVDLLEFLERFCDVSLFGEVLFRAGDELVVNLPEHCRDFFLDVVERHDLLFSCDAGDEDATIVFDVARADLKTDGHALHLVLAELPARRLIAVVEFDAERLCEFIADLARFFQHALFVLCDGDDHDLDRSDLRREDESVVVAVRHDDRADHTRRNAPRRLMRVTDFVVPVGERDVERFGESVAEVVRRAALERDAVVHHRLDGVRLFRAGKFFLLRLASRDRGDRERLEVEVLVNFQHAERFRARLVGRFVHRVSLLPEEFGRAEERARRLFPANDGAPLIIELRQVAVGMNDVFEMLAEERFRRRADAEALGELVLPADSYPRALRRESLDVIFLFLK